MSNKIDTLDLMDNGDKYMTPLEWRDFLLLEREPTNRVFDDVRRIKIDLSTFIRKYKEEFWKT